MYNMMLLYYSIYRLHLQKNQLKVGQKLGSLTYKSVEKK
jgi:hypothetical protein